MNARLMKNNHDRRVNSLERVSWLAFAIFFGLLISCGPVATAIPAATNAPATPAPVASATATLVATATIKNGVEPGSGYDVCEDTDAAWASIDNLKPPNQLYTLHSNKCDSNQWIGVVDDGFVTTNETGIALLHNSDCPGLYVFRNSGIQFSPCDPQGAGNGICMGGAFASRCDVGLASPSAELTLLGTWVSLITLDDGALSIVTVLEGAADVVPVTQLDGKAELRDDHSFVVEIAQRKLDETKKITLEENYSYFTASNDYLASLPAGVALLARKPLSQEQFQSLIGQLMPLYSLLPGYLEDVRGHAKNDGLTFPPVPEILLQGQGGFLTNNIAQKVVLIGVDWNAVQKNVAGPPPTSLTFQLPGREGLLTDPDYAYNPSNATIIAEAGKIKQIILLIPPGDDTLRRVANSMMESFKAIDISLNLEEVAPAEMQPKVNVMVASGMPVLWLEWR